MTICNPDGSVYRPSGTLSQLQPNSPSHALFQNYDAELIRLGGSPLLYFEVLLPSSSIDPQYNESRNKMWPQHPIELFAVYDPIPSEMSQGSMGIDGPNDQIIFYCNYKDVLARLGHLPIIGSRIYSPHLRENWEIVNRKLGDFQRWKVYRIEIHCIRFQESLTTGEGRVTQGTVTPDFNID